MTRLNAKGLRLFSLTVSLSGFLLVGCHRQAASSPVVLMNYQITPQPVRVGSTDVALDLRDAASKPLTGVHVDLEADMSHAGMAPVFGRATETGAGQYRGTISLNMPGDWVVLVHMTLPDQTKVDRQIDITGVEGK